MKIIVKTPKPRNKQPDIVRKAGPHLDARRRIGRKAKHKSPEID